MKNLPRIVATTLKMLLGMLFLFSAVSKFVSLDQFELYIYSFGLMSQGVAFVLARIVLACELLLGAMLLSNRFHHLACLLNVAGLLAFSGVLLYAHFSGRTDNCNCFGDLLPFTPLQSLAKNGVLLVLSLVAWRWANPQWRPHWFLALLMAMLPFVAIVLLALKGKVHMYVYELNLVSALAGCMMLIGLLSSLCLWTRSPFGQPMPDHLLWHRRRWLLIAMALTPFVAIAIVSTAPEDWTRGEFRYPFDRELVKRELSEEGALSAAGTHQGRKVVAFYSLHCDHCRATATKMRYVQSYNDLPDSCFVNVFMGLYDTAGHIMVDTAGMQDFFQSTGSPEYHHLAIDPHLFAAITRGQFPLVLMVEGDSVYGTFGTVVPERELLNFLHYKQ